MFKSYLKIALRNFTKNITFSLINLFGLSIAFALFILLSLYIRSELSTDKHIENKENIYCLLEKNSNALFTGGMFAGYINGRYPEVKQVCRSYLFDGNFYNKNGDFVYFDNFGTVDSNYFSIFKTETILGSLEHALDGDNGMVLTQSASKDLFNDKNPIGETVNWNNDYDFIVNAVIRDLPENSTYKVQCFVSLLCLNKLNQSMLTQPGNWSLTTFVEVQEKSDILLLEKKLSKDLLEQFKSETNWGLLPYSDIYFNQKVRGPKEFKHGNIQFVLLLIGIALFILVIACINYINLTTARAGSRAREVGIRKVVGAYKQKLMKQFLSESIFLIFVSLIIGFLLAELAIGEFNRLAGTNLHVKEFYEFPFNISFIIIAIVLGVLSGLYPALALTSFKTVEVIKGKISRSSGGIIARKMLMVFQFLISLVMIVGTIVILKQINYVKTINLGFDKENIIRLKGNDRTNNTAQAFKNELLAIPGVKKISLCDGVPGDIVYGMGDKIEDKRIHMKHLQIDENYIELMGLKIIDGRNFVSDSIDIDKTYLINEAAIKQFGWEEDPYRIKPWGLKLVGIVKDFNFESLHQPIGPLFITYSNYMQEIVIKISGSDQKAVIDNIEKAWIKQFPKDPFNYEFVDQVVDSLYKAEERLGKIVSYFSIFALIIACMGLLGMTSFMIQQRHREIGIRKVHGGSVQQIINMLSFEFVKWVILAFLLSVPLSYYIMKSWLAKNFTYQVEIEWWIFALSGIAVIIISLLTVIVQSYRAAMMNPVDSLRYE